MYHSTNPFQKRRRLLRLSSGFLFSCIFMSLSFWELEDAGSPALTSTKKESVIETTSVRSDMVGKKKKRLVFAKGTLFLFTSHSRRRWQNIYLYMKWHQNDDFDVFLRSLRLVNDENFSFKLSSYHIWNFLFQRGEHQLVFFLVTLENPEGFELLCYIAATQLQRQVS